MRPGLSASAHHQPSTAPSVWLRRGFAAFCGGVPRSSLPESGQLVVDGVLVTRSFAIGLIPSSPHTTLTYTRSTGAARSAVRPYTLRVAPRRQSSSSQGRCLGNVAKLAVDCLGWLEALEASVAGSEHRARRFSVHHFLHHLVFPCCTVGMVDTDSADCPDSARQFGVRTGLVCWSAGRLLIEGSPNARLRLGWHDNWCGR